MPALSPARVLHIITRFNIGGAQENTLLTALGQHRDPRFEVALLTGPSLGPEGSLEGRAELEGLPLLRTPHLIRAIDPHADMLALRDLSATIRRGRFDIVHTHCAKAGILGRAAARMAQTPTVVHTYHSLPFHPFESSRRNALYIALNRLCAPMTTAFVCVCDNLKNRALDAGIGRPKQYTTIYSGMDLSRFESIERHLSPAQARRKLGLPEDALVVGKVARLFPLKGHGHFFDAAKTIAAREPRAHFLLVGGGELRTALEARVEAMGLSDRTVWTGMIPPETIPAHIQAMDVLVHTSLREGLPRVLLQGGAVGKPVVSFAMDGAPEAIEEGVSGHICPPMDSAAVAEKVLSLLGDPARRRRYGLAGRRRACSRWSTARMVDDTHALYEQLLRRSRLSR